MRVSHPLQGHTPYLGSALLMDGEDEAPVHVPLHPCGLLVGMQVNVLWSLTWGLAQACSLNCLNSYSRIWACLLGRTGMLTSHWVLPEGRTAITAAPRQAG